jgi:hypothetical protein
MTLQIGQRWRHVYNSSTITHALLHHDFIVEVTKINYYITCKIVQVIKNDNPALHKHDDVGSEYLVSTIPKDKEFIVKGANTWTYLKNQDKSI